MNLTQTIKRLEQIEKEQTEIDKKYYLNNKGLRPTWKRKDISRYALLRKEQRKLIGVANGDILNTSNLTKIIVKIVKRTIKEKGKP